MKLNMDSRITAAVGGLATGAISGSIVVVATGRDLHIYMRFVGLLVLIALAVAGTYAWRRFSRPQPVAVEETSDGR